MNKVDVSCKPLLHGPEATVTSTCWQYCKGSIECGSGRRASLLEKRFTCDMDCSMAEVVASLGKSTRLRLGGVGPKGLATLGEELLTKLRLASLLSFQSAEGPSRGGAEPLAVTEECHG